MRHFWIKRGLRLGQSFLSRRTPDAEIRSFVLQRRYVIVKRTLGCLLEEKEGRVSLVGQSPRIQKLFMGISITVCMILSDLGCMHVLNVLPMSSSLHQVLLFASHCILNTVVI